MHEIDMLVVTCYIFDEYTFFLNFFCTSDRADDKVGSNRHR